jgi:hypothetical protein
VNVYRIFVMGNGRRFTSQRTFVCANDQHAIVWAEQLVDGHDVELWSGTRFVIHLSAAGEPGGSRAGPVQTPVDR